MRGRSTHRSYTLRQKLQLIVLPHVEFENTPVREAFAALQAMSKEWDADGRGVNFLLQLSKEEEARTVSLDMHRMSVEDLTRYACMSADLSHRVESSAVIVGPKGQDTTETVETRFYSINAGADLPGSKERDNKVLQDFFERTGITFPEKSSVALTPRGNKLVVTNTATNLRKLERVLVELGITTIVHTGPASGE